MKSFGDMMKQAQKVQKQMSELQETLAAQRHEATAGGGLVKAVVDGKQVLKSLTISPEALKDNDASMLEDLVITAIGEAQRTSSEAMAEAYARISGGFRLPM